MTITPLYAGILSILFVFLSVRTIVLRNKFKIGIGDSGNQELLRAIRVHSNFAEYVPLSLLLFVFVELKGASPTFCHILCGSLVLGRVMHAYGVSHIKETFYFRQIGMSLTFTPIIVSAIYLIARTI
jgi:uncharacterized membrane protein YecN with MAPEG domain